MAIFYFLFSQITGNLTRDRDYGVNQGKAAAHKLIASYPVQDATYLFNKYLLRTHYKSCPALHQRSINYWLQAKSRPLPIQPANYDGFSMFIRLEKIKSRIIFHMWKLHEIPILVSINKFYWNPATLIRVYIVYGHFCAARAELSSYKRDSLQSLKYLLSGPLQIKFANSCARC